MKAICQDNSQMRLWPIWHPWHRLRSGHELDLDLLQEMHNKVGKAVTGAEFRDGYEALNMTEARLGEIGVNGMVAPFSISCANHEGAGKFAVM